MAFDGYVYAISNGNAVKIGFAKNPIRRLSEINVATHDRCELIGFARANRAHEKEIHSIFASERIRGEWFRRGGTVEIFIDMLPKATFERILRHFPRAVSGNVGNKLAEFMKRSGITESEMAKRANCSQPTINKIKNGTSSPSFELIKEIHRATGGEVTPNDFLVIREKVDSSDSVARAIVAAGGSIALADAIGGITRQAVEQWKRIPSSRVLEVERLTGIPRHDLRPDLYPRE
jgi:DNA-binding transcriptional regulator YdaS (Cro superfamily)